MLSLSEYYNELRYRIIIRDKMNKKFLKSFCMILLGIGMLFIIPIVACIPFIIAIALIISAKRLIIKHNRIVDYVLSVED
jgi:hypothetical protein